MIEEELYDGTIRYMGIYIIIIIGIFLYIGHTIVIRALRKSKSKQELEDPPAEPTISFVEKALETNNQIEKHRKVKCISKRKLQGGCHYTVYKLMIEYQDREEAIGKRKEIKKEEDIEDTKHTRKAQEEEQEQETRVITKTKKCKKKLLEEITSKQKRIIKELKESKERVDTKVIQIDEMNETLKEPPTIIIKYLDWGYMSYFERFKLYCRQVLSHHNKQSMYYQSYQIESLFYSNVRDEVERQYKELKEVGVKRIHGLKVPEVYYNYADKLNMRFVMIMQDIRWHRSRMKTGQGMGFTLKQASYCLASLAKFHASCQNHPMLQTMNPVWDLGGYWTGLKRAKDKKHIAAFTKKAEHQLPLLQFPSQFGERMERHLDAIMNHVNDLPRTTFVHGDFKITNIFINKKKNIWTIDWQWLGRGVGAIDIAYFMLTSMRADTMKYQTLYELTKRVYFEQFAASVPEANFQILWRDVAMCMVDFFIYVVVSKWAFMSPNDVQDYAKKKKDGLHLQRYDNMQKMINLTVSMMNHLQLY